MRVPTDDADDAHFSTNSSPESVFCGVVVRADRVADGLALETCTVGGNDATDTIAPLYDSLGREDVRYLLVSGIAPAWFNLVDIDRLAATLDHLIPLVSLEGGERFEPALIEQSSGVVLDRRLATYRAAPSRRSIEVNRETVSVRAVGCDGDEAVRVIRGLTPTDGRPEPIHVTRMATRTTRRSAGG